MKTTKILATCAIFMALFSLSSCNKEAQTVAEPRNVEPVEDDLVFQDCHNHQLEHFDAVAPTATTGGNIEYWYCKSCRKYYSDAEGKNQIATPYLRSLNRVAVQSVLAKYPVSFAWSSEYGLEPQTKGGATAALQAVKAGVGIVSGALSATNSLKKLITNEGGKELEYFNQIIDGVEQLQKDMTTVLSRTNAILEAIEDENTKEYITQSTTRLSNIWENTLLFINSINDYLELYEKGEITEEYAEEQIVATLKIWTTRTNSSGINYEYMIPSVENMINDFLATNVGDTGVVSEPYTATVRRHVQSYIAFDNMGYGDRANMIRYYQFCLAPAFYLWKLYRYNVDPTKEKAYITWKNSVEKCENDFVSMKELISADSLNMNNAYKHYRVFRPNLSSTNGVYYYKAKVLGPFDFAKWIDAHYWDTNAKQARAFFPPDNYKGRFDEYMEKMWNETTGIKDRSNLVIEDDYTRMLSEYPGSSIYNVIKENADFEGAHLYKEHVNNKSYSIFYWWEQDTYISYSVQEGVDYDKVKQVNNMWKCINLMSVYTSGICFYGDFSITSTYSDTGWCVLNKFSMQIPMNGCWKRTSTSDNDTQWGSIRGADEGGCNMQTCYGILERYTGEIYE